MILDIIKERNNLLDRFDEIIVGIKGKEKEELCTLIGDFEDLLITCEYKIENLQDDIEYLEDYIDNMGYYKR